MPSEMAGLTPRGNKWINTVSQQDPVRPFFLPPGNPAQVGGAEVEAPRLP